MFRTPVVLRERSSEVHCVGGICLRLRICLIVNISMLLPRCETCLMNIRAFQTIQVILNVGSSFQTKQLAQSVMVCEKAQGNCQLRKYSPNKINSRLSGVDGKYDKNMSVVSEKILCRFYTLRRKTEQWKPSGVFKYILKRKQNSRRFILFVFKKLFRMKFFFYIGHTDQFPKQNPRIIRSRLIRGY